LGEDSNLSSKFRVDADSGEICLASALDHEQESAYDLTIVAVDRVGQFLSLPVRTKYCIY
jgi:Cadherin domain